GQHPALGDHGHPQSAEPADPAAVGLLDPGQHLEQRGLTAAVETDHPDPLARMHPQRDPVEQWFDPETLADLFEIDQVGHESFRLRCRPRRYATPTSLSRAPHRPTAA